MPDRQVGNLDPTGNYGLGQSEADKARAWAKDRERKQRERDKKRRQRGQNRGQVGTLPKSGSFIEGCDHIWQMPDGKLIGIGFSSEVDREVAMLRAEGRMPRGSVGMAYPNRERKFDGPGTVDLRKVAVLGVNKRPE